MNESVKKKWVAALRGGEYKQGSGELRSGGAFCCLGVLCNLHAQSHPKIAATQLVSSYYLGENAYLPDEVQKWAGLDHYQGAFVLVNDKDLSLVDLNDGNHCSSHSFEAIAAVIEAQL